MSDSACVRARVFPCVGTHPRGSVFHRIYPKGSIGDGAGFYFEWGRHSLPSGPWGLRVTMVPLTRSLCWTMVRSDHHGPVGQEPLLDHGAFGSPWSRWPGASVGPWCLRVAMVPLAKSLCWTMWPLGHHGPASQEPPLDHGAFGSPWSQSAQTMFDGLCRTVYSAPIRLNYVRWALQNGVLSPNPLELCSIGSADLCTQHQTGLNSTLLRSAGARPNSWLLGRVCIGMRVGCVAFTMSGPAPPVIFRLPRYTWVCVRELDLQWNEWFWLDIITREEGSVHWWSIWRPESFNFIPDFIIPC